MTRINPTLALRSLSRFVVTLLVLGASAADAALTTSKCLVLKRQAWGTLRKCEATEQVKRLKGKPADLAKCQTKFQETLTKITAKAADVAIACRYGDNGDRTVTDYDTGLQWEKKSGRAIFGSDEFFCLAGDVQHCVNDKYDWYEAQIYVSGTGGRDGVTIHPFLAGHADWRLPTVVELQTILLEPSSSGCGQTVPCIDPIFGPTLAAEYWSSTTDDSAAIFALEVGFYDTHGGSTVGADGRTGNPRYVRAVRGGL